MEYRNPQTSQFINICFYKSETLFGDWSQPGCATVFHDGRNLKQDNLPVSLQGRKQQPRVISSQLPGESPDYLNRNWKLFSKDMYIYKRENALKCIRSSHCPVDPGCKTHFGPATSVPSPLHSPLAVLRAQIVSTANHRALRSEHAVSHISYSPFPKAL